MKHALTKGLAILLPALITIAVFAWAWGVTRDYAVVVIIDVVDTMKFVSPPEVLSATQEERQLAKEVSAEPKAKVGQRVAWLTPDQSVYIMDKTGKEPREEVLLLPDEAYSPWAVLSAYMGQHRTYNYSSGEVIRYSTVEYVVAVLLAIALIVLIGIFARGFFGRQLTNLLDGLLKRIPIINLVYPYAKQVVDFVFSEDKPIEFDAVVAVEWPREGCWQLGFVTGSGMTSMTEQVGTTHTTVFVPMSPLPMTGFTVFVPSEQVMEIDLSVEEACMVILSGGVLTPPDQQKVRGGANLEEWKRRISQARVERGGNTSIFDKINTTRQEAVASSEENARSTSESKSSDNENS